MSQAALHSKLKEPASAINYTKEIIEILSSKELLRKTREREEIMVKLRQKMDKAMANLTKTTKILENKKVEIEELTVSLYRSVMQDDTSDPDPHIVKKEIDGIRKQARDLELHLKKLGNEKKIIEFHKKHHKLQKKIANIHFDLSDEASMKGYIQKQDGKLQTFEFDKKNCPCDIADYLWDNI